MLFPSSLFSFQKPQFQRERERESSEMASSLLHPYEEYKEMEVNTHSNSIGHRTTASSPPSPPIIEFEFQKLSTTTSVATTADELFYKGKLLPLHLPPRLKLIEKLLHNHTNPHHKNTIPSQQYNNFSEYFTQSNTISITQIPKNKSKIGSKIKTSTIYLKSLITRSSCSRESSVFASRWVDERSVVNAKKVSKNERKEIQSGSRSHRRWFSGDIMWNSTPKTPLDRFQELKFLKMNKADNWETENLIQAAIAHCKRSNQRFQSRKNANDIGIPSLSSSMIVYEDQERSELCRG